jgi:GNAT superfamily N-acetyltransferase
MSVQLHALDARVQTAQGDAWQAEGRLRTGLGGGAAELPGIRLMASGLPHPQWNSGDVTDPARLDLEAVRAWFAARAGGAGVPWGLRLPAGVAFAHGRLLFRKRCMGLVPAAFRPRPMPQGVRIRVAQYTDIDAIALVDASAFGDSVVQNLPWVAPHVGAPGFTAALATGAGRAVGVATAIRTDDRAGCCVGIFGVGVLADARRRGIGGALTSWLLARAFAEGALLAHLNPDSDPAANLYARQGFAETAGFDIYADV